MKMIMKMGILNLSKAPQVTKTGIEGVQNQRNLVTVHSLMPTLNLKKNKWKLSLCTDVPSPSGKIGRRDVCESPSLIVFRYTFA